MCIIAIKILSAFICKNCAISEKSEKKVAQRIAEVNKTRRWLDGAPHRHACCWFLFQLMFISVEESDPAFLNA